MVWGVPFLTPYFYHGRKKMVKLLCGVAFTTLFLGGLVFVPYFVNYSYMPNLWFGLNNLAFLTGGLVIGGIIYREFFTDELPEIPPSSALSRFEKASKKFDPNNFIIDNDSLGGKNAN